jgi:hypothetical protein
MQDASNELSNQMSQLDTNFESRIGTATMFPEGRAKLFDADADLLGFNKQCALCDQKFPRKSMDHTVLWKHVIAIKRKWSPDLVPKEIELLDNTISMFNTVRVCVFCSQYFDPDIEGGINPPMVESPKHIDTTRPQCVRGLKQMDELVRFYDARFPNMENAGRCLRDTTALRSRQGARKAIEVQRMVAQAEAEREKLMSED